MADDNTYAVAGAAVAASLAAAGVRIVDRLIFPGQPVLYADYANVVTVRQRLAGWPSAAACSIAAGTLNDIVKLASAELGRQYVNVCTAASVDGYAAFGASITHNGFKITRDCPAPVGLVADTDVLAAAPARLTATGYGDLIEKIPAGADWLLADALGIEPIQPAVWDTVQSPLRDALSQPELIAAGHPLAIRRLAECNLLSGLAMQAAQSSRPASGAGHQFSHVWEMEGHGLDWDPPLSHGFKVAVGAVASCALWQAVLDLDLGDLDVEAIVADAPSPDELANRLDRMLPPRIAAEARPLYLAKQLRGDAFRQRLRQIQSDWPGIRQVAAAQLLGPAEVATWLRAAGAPYHPHQIGLTLGRLRRTYAMAQMIRARYTVLDLLADLRLLGTVVDRLFAPRGFWATQPAPAYQADASPAATGRTAATIEGRRTMMLVSKAYYLGGKSKVAIASELGISRFKVARYLDEALRIGMVSITLNSGGVLPELSDRLRLHLGLRAARAVETYGAYEEVRATVARMAGAYLQEVLIPGEVLGIGWGRTLDAMFDGLDHLPPVEVLELAGRFDADSADAASELAQRAISLTGRQSRTLAVPFFTDDARAAMALRRQPHVASLIAGFSRVTTAVVAVGTLPPQPLGVAYSQLPERFAELVTRSGAMGEVLGNLFDADGQSVDLKLHRHTLAINATQLLAVPRVILAAAGQAKAAAVHAVASSGLPTDLIVDAELADALLSRPRITEVAARRD